jgi:hypothetical protein
VSSRFEGSWWSVLHSFPEDLRAGHDADLVRPPGTIERKVADLRTVHKLFLVPDDQILVFGIGDENSQ